MILDTVKRILGIGGNPTRQETENQPGTSPGLNGQLFPHRQVVPPEITQIESEMAQIHKFMEQQMRSMIGSFGFSFGGPFSGFGFEDSANGQFPPFSFTPQVPQIPFNPGDPEVDNVPLNPRDEVLKPQFRSRPSGLWNGQDQILDNRVNTEGIDAVMDELSPPSERQDGSLMGNFSQFFGNGLFSGSIFENDTFGRSFSQENGSSVSSSTVTTIYSNVNGYKSVEKIVRHPDGKVERTVITDNINPDHR